MAIRVVIAEDFRMIREIFEAAVEQSENYILAGSFPTAQQAVKFLEKEDADLVLMDVLIPGSMNGLDAAAQIKEKKPQLKIIIVTSMPECSYMDRARAAGVESFWYKEISREPILELMDRTMAGESVYPDALPEVRIGAASSREFTDRELEVLRELTSGDPDTEIAARLNMSVWTVRTHIRHLLEKTGFDSRTRLAVAARESGLVIRGY